RYSCRGRRRRCVFRRLLLVPSLLRVFCCFCRSFSFGRSFSLCLLACRIRVGLRPGVGFCSGLGFHCFGSSGSGGLGLQCLTASVTHGCLHRRGRKGGVPLTMGVHRLP